MITNLPTGIANTNGIWFRSFAALQRFDVSIKTSVARLLVTIHASRHDEHRIHAFLCARIAILLVRRPIGVENDRAELFRRARQTLTYVFA